MIVADSSYRLKNANLPQDEWLLYVGYVYPKGYDGPTYGDEGILDKSLTRLDNTCTAFRWKDDSYASMHRAYLYYSGDPTEKQFYFRPRVDKLGFDQYSSSNIIGRWTMARDRNGSVNGEYKVSDCSRRGVDMILHDKTRYEDFKDEYYGSCIATGANNWLYSAYDARTNISSGYVSITAKVQWNGIGVSDQNTIIRKKGHYKLSIIKQADGTGRVARAVAPDWVDKTISEPIKLNEIVFLSVTYGPDIDRIYVGRPNGEFLYR
jgi:hypothetical protein